MIGPVLFLLFTYVATYAAMLPIVVKLTPEGERRIQLSLRTARNSNDVLRHALGIAYMALRGY